MIGPLWKTSLGTVEPLALVVGIGSEGKSILEQESISNLATLVTGH
jgi:hypothetical protein